MNPKTRRLVKITPEGEKETNTMFNTLLGDDMLGRKKFIKDHGEKYIDLTDIS